MQTSFQPIVNFGSPRLLARLQLLLSSSGNEPPPITPQEKTQINYLLNTGAFENVNDNLEPPQVEKLFALRKQDFTGPQQFLLRQEAYLREADMNAIIQLQQSLTD